MLGARAGAWCLAAQERADQLSSGAYGESILTDQSLILTR